MNARLLEILQHALGVDQYGRGEMYRNHFCAGGPDEDLCRELVALGYMKTFTRSYLPYYNCTVTESGIAAMRAASPKPPKLTRSQQRYRRFLSFRDAYGDATFLDFLKYEAHEARMLGGGRVRGAEWSAKKEGRRAQRRTA